VTYACPITFDKIDINLFRINTLLVSLLIVMYLFFPSIYILYFLVFDFSVKLFIKKKYSPLYLLARFLRKGLGLNAVISDGGAKRLAQYFGLFFMLLLIGAHFIQNTPLLWTIAIIYLLCALFDIVFNFCIGCKIYHIIKKIYPNFMN
jgi:hypothetical protein